MNVSVNHTSKPTAFKWSRTVRLPDRHFVSFLHMTVRPYSLMKFRGKIPQFRLYLEFPRITLHKYYNVHTVKHSSCILYYPLETVRPIHRTGTPLPSKHPILYIFSTNILLNILNRLHNLRFFSSKCRLFHNATFFGSCIIRILHTGCAKI
jgi:hypothetical protein